MQTTAGRQALQQISRQGGVDINKITASGQQERLTQREALRSQETMQGRDISKPRTDAKSIWSTGNATVKTIRY